MRAAINSWGLWDQVAGIGEPHIMHGAGHTDGFRFIHEQYQWKSVTALSSNAWLGLPHGHVTCPGPGNRQPYIDIATET